MAELVDARGLSCPKPVLLTLGRIRSGAAGELEILIDTDTSRENVVRALTGQGWAVRSIAPEGIGYRIAAAAPSPRKP
ncbi:MAG: sulfurtransferase TusA family protein [Deferrisomatales bacterium]